MIQTPIQGIGTVVNFLVAIRLSDKIKSKEPAKDFQNSDLEHSLETDLQPITQIAIIYTPTGTYKAVPIPGRIQM